MFALRRTVSDEAVRLLCLQAASHAVQLSANTQTHSMHRSLSLSASASATSTCTLHINTTHAYRRVRTALSFSSPRLSVAGTRQMEILLRGRVIRTSRCVDMSRVSPRQPRTEEDCQWANPSVSLGCLAICSLLILFFSVSASLKEISISFHSSLSSLSGRQTFLADF